MHIVDVTDPENTTWMGEYYDPNTQVLDVKYIQHDGREYVVLQNQLVDPGLQTRMWVRGKIPPGDSHTRRGD